MFNAQYTNKAKLLKDLKNWALTIAKSKHALKNVTINVYGKKYMATHGCYQTGADLHFNAYAAIYK